MFGAFAAAFRSFERRELLAGRLAQILQIARQIQIEIRCAALDTSARSDSAVAGRGFELVRTAAKRLLHDDCPDNAPTDQSDLIDLSCSVLPCFSFFLRNPVSKFCKI